MWGTSTRRCLEEMLFAETEKPGTISSGLSLIDSYLQNLYVFRLEAFRPLNDIELDCLTFLKAPETVRLNCRKVNEDIFAILAADKSKSLCVVKPLHCSLFHFVCTFSLCFVLNFLLRRSDATESGARKVIRRYQLKIAYVPT
jgi:hypothetical protein